MLSLRRSSSLVVALGLLTTCAQADSPPLKKGERIVFLGDSITEAGVGPHGYVTLIKKRLAEKYAAGRVIGLLEGGYNLDLLGNSVTSHLGALV